MFSRKTVLFFAFEGKTVLVEKSHGFNAYGHLEKEVCFQFVT